ncbi:Isocitrate dehydrogenase kinase/phosphatase [compost metagenome]
MFPQSFAPFLLGHPAVREVFLQHHADLLDPAFWQAYQQRIRQGYVHDVFPYERERRLAWNVPAPSVVLNADSP